MIDLCVAAINTRSRAAVRVTRGTDDLCVWAIEGGQRPAPPPGARRPHTRTPGTIDLGRPVQQIRHLNSSTGRPIVPVGHVLHFTVPARGLAVIDVEFAVAS